MAAIPREINEVCRLCLCQDENILFPATKFIDSQLTLDDVERVAGVRIVEQESMRCVLCVDCNNKLRHIKAFKASCISNDETFRKWFTVADKDCSRDDTHPLKLNAAAQAFNGAARETDQCNDSANEFDEATFFDNNIVVIKEEEIDDQAVKYIVQEMYEDMEVLTEDVVDFDVDDDDEDAEEFSEDMKTEGSQTSIDDFVTSDDPGEASVPYEPYERQPTTPNETSAPAIPADHQTVTATASEETGKKKNPQKKTLCPLCGKLILSLKDHMLSHTGEKQYRCKYCPKTCGRKGSLRLHMQAVHLKKIVKSCEICGKGFTYVESHEAHMRAKHDFGEPFECTICNIKFRHKGGLRGHNNRKHNDESNCECPTCGMKFLDKKGLRAHSIVHSDERPFGCRYCPKMFKTAKTLKNHENLHQGVTFSCTMCGKSYKHQSLLYVHMKKCHDEGKNDKLKLENESN